MAEEDEEEKTEEPSQRKLEEARKKGEVAQSKELSAVLILFATLMTVVLSSIYTFDVMMAFIEWTFRLEPQQIFNPKQLQEIFIECLKVALKCVAPAFIVSFCIGIISHVMQIGFLYAPEVLTFKLERINPVSGFKRLLSMKSIVEAVKGVFKFTVILAVTYSILGSEIREFSGFLHTDVWGAVAHSKSIAIKLSFAILLGLLIVALGDYAWVKYSFLKKMRMSKQELKKEMKEQEGSPELRQRIRQVQREMAQRRMMEAVRTADVIVTNPTHISVALKYDPQTMIAPAVVAKGADNIAMRIREIAKENNVALVENVPLARTLYKTVKIGEGVPRSLYKAVAEILAFVYRLKKKQKAIS